jgi:Protein of unknown function (DUF2934)
MKSRSVEVHAAPVWTKWVNRAGIGTGFVSVLANERNSFMAAKVVKGAESVTKPVKEQSTAAKRNSNSNSGSREEKIRDLAYQKWVAAGRPPGDGLPFWLEAERECGNA